MKTNFLFALILASATLLRAGTTSELNLKIENSSQPGQVVIQLEGLDQQRTQLNIQDLSGKKWFSEQIRQQNRYSKTVKLSQLPVGIYLVQVKNDRVQQSRAFRFDQQQVTLFEATTDANAPGGLVLNAGGTGHAITRIAVTEAQTLRLQLSNIGTTPAALQLWAPDGSLRWEASFENQASVVKMLDLKALKIEPGLYLLSIQIGSAVVIQELEQNSAGLQLGQAHQLSIPMAGAEMARQ